MIDLLLSKLNKVKSHGDSRWVACCPAHEDKTPSLAIKKLRDGRILVHCFAGCSALDIVESVGLTMTDLFPDGALGEFKGFEQLKNDLKKSQEQKQQQQSELDKTYLSIAEGMRSRGEKLTRKDMELEAQAYLRMRNANTNR